MAHIVVYLQRTPQGLHPASSVALCLARDLGSERGATVTAACSGDAGPLDRSIVAAAARYGADVMLFCGPEGLDHLEERLRPVHTLTPWTPEGMAAVQGLRAGPAVPRWLDARRPAWGGADAVTGVVAGTLPWHDLDVALEAEYEGDIDDVPLPPWVEGVPVADADEPALVPALGFEPLAYIAPDGLDREVDGQLRAMGAEPSTLGDVQAAQTGTALWLSPGAGAIPEDISPRDPAMRLILLPGPDGSFDPSWSQADYVLAGAWPEVLADLERGPWRPPLSPTS